MAKAFIEGMKDIPSNIIQHFEHAISAVTKVTGDPNATWTDVKDAIETVDQDFKNACKETGKTATDAARAEFEEHVLKGLSKEDAEKWVMHKAEAVKDLAEKARHAAPKVGLAAKAAGLAITAAVVGVIGLIVGISGNKDGQNYAKVSHQNDWQLAQVKFNLKLGMSTENFLGMVNGLNIPNLPPALVLQETPVAVAVAMPVTVRAVAGLPLLVEVSHGSSTYRGRTTVGEVYQKVPQARQEIEDHASTIRDDDNQQTNERVERAYAAWTKANFPTTARDDHQQQHRVQIDVDCRGELGSSAHFFR